MPFGSSLKLDMEVWAFTEKDMGYQVGAYWYGFAETTSNHRPEPDETLNVPVVPDIETATKNADSGRFKNAVEISLDRVIASPNTIELKPQNLKKLRLKGSWNQNDHVLFKNARIGDVVEIRIPTASSAAEKLTLHATKSWNFGVLRFSANGKIAGPDVDLFAEKPTTSDPISLGTVDPVDGAYVLRVEVVGKNPNSKAAFFGLDCVTLHADP